MMSLIPPAPHSPCYQLGIGCIPLNGQIRLVGWRASWVGVTVELVVVLESFVLSKVPLECLGVHHIYDLTSTFQN